MMNAASFYRISVAFERTRTKDMSESKASYPARGIGNTTLSKIMIAASFFRISVAFELTWTKDRAESQARNPALSLMYMNFNQ